MSVQTSTRQPYEARALLFDFGNTLAFLDYNLLARELSLEGQPLDPLGLEEAEYSGRRALDRFMMGGGGLDVGRAYGRFFRAWMEAAEIAPEQVRECARRFNAMHQEATLWRVVRPGTFEVLEKFKSAGFKLAIVSNADGKVASDVKRFGLAPYFDVIVDSEVVGVVKPDPRIFRIALEHLGVRPEQALYAGDIYSIDILGAQAAGIESRLIDQMGRYHWVEHDKIRDISGLHPLGEDGAGYSTKR